MNKNWYLVTNKNTYIREFGNKCEECELPRNLCNRVKCIDNKKRYIWKNRTEEVDKFIKSKNSQTTDAVNTEVNERD